MSACQEQRQSEGVEDACDPSTTLVDLPALILHRVLGLLDPRDLCAAAQACKLLSEASQHDPLWQAAALRRWPHDSVTLDGDAYATFKELVLDDNRDNTAWYLPLDHDACCNYLFARDDYYFQCRMIGMERPRGGSNEFRLYYDARGEADLRAPITSRLLLEFHFPCAYDDIEIAASLKPAADEQYVSRPGHYKGCLVWSADDAGVLEDAISATHTADERFQHMRIERTALVFQFAGAMPHAASDDEDEDEEEGDEDLLTDYTGRQVWVLEQNEDFEQAWRSKAVMTARGGMGRQLAAEGEEEQRRRWAHLPQGVKDRGSAWPGADGFGEWQGDGAQQ